MKKISQYRSEAAKCSVLLYAPHGNIVVENGGKNKTQVYFLKTLQFTFAVGSYLFTLRT